MNGTTPPNTPARCPRVLAIAIAVAGLAGAVLFFSQTRSLQTKLDETSGKLEQTQTQLEDAAKELQQTQDELARLRAALSAKQQQLIQASNQIQDVQGELEAAESQVAQMVPSDTETGEMPVMFGFRRVPAGKGYILWFQNKTTKTLPLKVTVTDAAGRRANPLRVVLEGAAVSGTGFFAAALKEIGEAGGRAFVSGDKIEIACTGYAPIRKTLP